MNACLIDGCPYPAVARGYCRMHYTRLRTSGTLEGRVIKSPSFYFWRQVNKTDTCWLWTGKDVTPNGYGRFTYRVSQWHQRRTMAHRWAYEELVDPIPEGMTLDHLCGVNLCVNPAHLELVSLRENILRSDNPMAQNARKTHCPVGHPYDEANTYMNQKGERICKECSRTKARESYRTKRRAQGLEIQPYVGLRTHCPQGHEYTPENTYLYKGRRSCRACQKVRSSYAAKKERQRRLLSTKT